MTDYNNPRPLPTASASDPCTIVDNAVSLDKVINGDSTVTTYTGKQILSLSQAIDKFGFVVAPFTFTTGGTLESKNLLVSNDPVDGFLYRYVGAGTGSIVVTAGTDPTTGTDWEAFTATAAEFISNANGGSVQDFIDNLAAPDSDVLVGGVEAGDLARRYSESVSLTDFEHLSLGSDWTAALQAAVDASLTVSVPNGRYDITATVYMNRNRLSLLGQRGTLLNFISSDEYLFDSTSQSNFKLTIKNIEARAYGEKNKGFLKAKTGLGTVSNTFEFDDVSLVPDYSESSNSGWGSPNGVIRASAAIFSVFRKFRMLGNHAGDSESPALTTLRQSVGVNLLPPWNTAVDFTDNCSIGGFKIGVQFFNGWNISIKDTALENNFLQVVSLRDPSSPFNQSLNNIVQNCYIEYTKYLNGGAGRVYDEADPTDLSKQGSLVFIDNYHNTVRAVGSATNEDDIDRAYGRIGQINRTLPSTGVRNKEQRDLSRFQYVEICYSENERFGFYDKSSGYGAVKTLYGGFVSFRRDINNPNLASGYVEAVSSTNEGNSADYCIKEIVYPSLDNPTNENYLAGAVLNNVMRIRGGNMYLKGGGAYNTSGADYAEMFEWLDGNPSGEDRTGKLVELVGDKIQIATNASGVIGCISATASVIGNNWSEFWIGRYLTDSLGRQVLDEGGAPIANPFYDDAVIYKPRSERREWGVVGLFGRLRVLKGQTVPESWIKLKDLDDDVSEYLVK